MSVMAIDKKYVREVARSRHKPWPAGLTSNYLTYAGASLSMPELTTNVYQQGESDLARWSCAGCGDYEGPRPVDVSRRHAAAHAEKCTGFPTN